MTSALSGDPGVLTPRLGAEPAEPGRPLSHTHSQHLERRPVLSAGVSASFASISQLVPAYPGPVLGCPRVRTVLPARLWRASRKLWVCAEGLGWFLYTPCGNGDQSLHYHLALPLSSTRTSGLAPRPGGPGWALLSRASARRGAGPGRIPCAEGGRTESGAGGCGPTGVQGTHKGMAARRAGGQLWPLP